MFLPKFIHILSTKLTKCAIYKANFFAFRLITYVHYIITNNNAIFVAVRSVVLQLICAVLMQATFAKLPPLQRYNVTPDFHHLRKCMIYLFRVRVPFAVCCCRYVDDDLCVIFAVCVVSCMVCYCLSVDISVICFQSYSVLYVLVCNFGSRCIQAL